jgi:hypothetical protein
MIATIALTAEPRAIVLMSLLLPPAARRVGDRFSEAWIFGLSTGSS